MKHLTSFFNSAGKHKLLILILFIFGITDANAKLIYKKLDTTMSATKEEKVVSFEVDFNNDGLRDFHLTHENMSGYYTSYIFGKSDTTTSEVQVDVNSTAFMCLEGDVISGKPFNNNYRYYTMGALDGNWKGAGNKFIPVRFKIGNNTYYGWVRVCIPFTGSNLKAIDCAYEDVAGDSIVAGDGIVLSALNDEPTRDNGVSIVLRGRELQIDMQNSLSRNSVIIYDLTGRTLLQDDFEGRQRFLFLDSFNPGLYLLEIRSGDQLITKKLLVD